MNDPRSALPDSRARVGWWLFVLALAALAAYITYSFVGLFVLGIFGYYATRPIYQRLGSVVDSDSIAAGVTVLLVLVPIVVLALYAGFQVFQRTQEFLGNAANPLALVGNYLNTGALPQEQQRMLASVIQNPQQLVTNPQETAQTLLQIGVAVFSALVGTLLFLALAITLSYFLLQNDQELSDGLRQLFGGEDSTAYAYATAVDSDLESVFFGNLLFVVVMFAISAVAYWGTNALAPGALQIPIPFVLAFLTGVASLVPLVVGKLVYVPVVVYLALQSLRAGGNYLPFVGGALVVYFLLLDILPQTFLQPYITGRQLDMVVMMFAYLLGPVLFGWYGFFLLPILFILMLEAIRIVLPQLVRGEPLTPTVSLGESVGTDPGLVRERSAAGDDATADDGAAETE